MAKREDTGYLSSVPAHERLDFDGEDPADYALEGGDDTEHIAQVLANYGEVVAEEDHT